MKKKLITIFVIITIISIGSGIVAFYVFQQGILKNYDYEIQVAFQNLTFTNPVGIYDSGDDTNRLFVVEQDGRILVFENNENVTDYQVFLDISSQIAVGGEKGLLGLAFHPNFSNNGYFYVYYIDVVSDDSILSRLKVNSSDINKANKSSETILLTIPQPYSNHNGGQISFGPDGYLYIALGDGGGIGDPDSNGQNRQTLLGSILRIDINSGFPYSIPIDNPFYGNINGWAEEIFAFGFRNPWRFSFDPITGFLWTGDVGQGSWEEIDLVENGKNYGWSTKEGFHNFNSGTNVTILEDPIYEYGHIIGRSITGGYVYRGSTLTSLIGKYIYADFISGRIWALEYSGTAVLNNTELINTNLNISSFGIDATNELFICAFDGRIYKLIQK
ncbi:MAG: PQQ-dependent sugar dehydrogenase [Candidatus Heimdallarchaeota archaeon]